MKTFILTLGILVTQLVCFGQAKLSMSKYKHFIPADTVSFGTNVQLQVYIKNTGNLPFTGNIKLTAKRDTLGLLAIVLDSINFTGVTLLPLSADSIPAIINFTPTPASGAFKVMGNGNVIVVWPISGTTLLGDSVRPILFISGAVGVNELKEGECSVYPNPSNGTIKVNLPHNEAIKSYAIYDVFGRKVKEEITNENMTVSELDNGLYWLILFTENKSYKTKIMKQ